MLSQLLSDVGEFDTQVLYLLMSWVKTLSIMFYQLDMTNVFNSAENDAINMC